MFNDTSEQKQIGYWVSNNDNIKNQITCHKTYGFKKISVVGHNLEDGHTETENVSLAIRTSTNQSY